MQQDGRNMNRVLAAGLACPISRRRCSIAKPGCQSRWGRLALACAVPCLISCLGGSCCARAKKSVRGSKHRMAVEDGYTGSLQLALLPSLLAGPGAASVALGASSHRCSGWTPSVLRDCNEL